MRSHQRHESTMNNPFSFSNSLPREEETQIPSSSHNMADYNRWAEGIKSNYTKFGNRGNRNSGAWSSRIPPNSNSMQFDREEEFGWLAKKEDSDSDTPSPTLWNNSPTRENLYGVRSNDCKFGNYPTARAQEIAGYRKEMINMVRELPETAYELSLRDIVEKRKEFEEIKQVKEKPKTKKEKKKGIKKNSSVSRSKSDTGLLIKLFLPLSVGKKSFNGLFKEQNESKKETKEKEKKIKRNKFNDEEWWKKNEFSEKGSSKASSGSSSSSYHSGSSRGYNVSRNGSRKRNGCYSFFRPGKIRHETSS